MEKKIGIPQRITVTRTATRQIGPRETEVFQEHENGKIRTWTDRKTADGRLRSSSHSEVSETGLPEGVTWHENPLYKPQGK